MDHGLYGWSLWMTSMDHEDDHDDLEFALDRRQKNYIWMQLFVRCVAGDLQSRNWVWHKLARPWHHRASPGITIQELLKQQGDEVRGILWTKRYYYYGILSVCMQSKDRIFAIHLVKSNEIDNEYLLKILPEVTPINWPWTQSRWLLAKVFKTKLQKYEKLFQIIKNHIHQTIGEKGLPLSKKVLMWVSYIGISLQLPGWILRVRLPPSPAKVGGTNKRRATVRVMQS